MGSLTLHWTAWLLVLTAGINSCIGNLLLKKSRLVARGDEGLFDLLLSPWFIGGLLFYGINVILFAKALEKLASLYCLSRAGRFRLCHARAGGPLVVRRTNDRQPLYRSGGSGVRYFYVGPILMKAHLKLLRPHQWSKNILVFAGWIFGGHVGQPALLWLELAVFLTFCAISSAVYILNDIVDRERDRRHPSKCKRPIASGEVSVRTAAVLGGGLALGALLGAWALGWSTLACVLFYIGNNLLYSFFFKHIAVIDVLSIAFGFILRLLAGVYVFGELPTSWAVLCVLFLALFLAIAKRRAELRQHNRPGRLATAGTQRLYHRVPGQPAQQRRYDGNPVLCPVHGDFWKKSHAGRYLTHRILCGHAL